MIGPTRKHLEMDQAIRGELIDPSLSVAGRTFKTIGDLISLDVGDLSMCRLPTAEGTDVKKRLDCLQQVAEGYRFSDIGITSALQGFLFILRRCKSGYGNDRNGLGLIILFKQTGHVEPADVGQSNIHQD